MHLPTLTPAARRVQKISTVSGTSIAVGNLLLLAATGVGVLWSVLLAITWTLIFGIYVLPYLMSTARLRHYFGVVVNPKVKTLDNARDTVAYVISLFCTCFTIVGVIGFLTLRAFTDHHLLIGSVVTGMLLLLGYALAIAVCDPNPVVPPTVSQQVAQATAAAAEQAPPRVRCLPFEQMAPALQVAHLVGPHGYRRDVIPDDTGARTAMHRADHLVNADPVVQGLMQAHTHDWQPRTRLTAAPTEQLVAALRPLRIGDTVYTETFGLGVIRQYTAGWYAVEYQRSNGDTFSVSGLTADRLTLVEDD